jgi:hypothetical protein
MYKVFNTDKEITDYSNKSGLVKELVKDIYRDELYSMYWMKNEHIGNCIIHGDLDFYKDDSETVERYNENVVNRTNYINELENENKWREISHLFGSGHKFKWLVKNKDKIKDDKVYYQILRETYITTEFPLSECSKSELLSLFKDERKDYLSIMNKDEKMYLDNLDDEVNVYRGINTHYYDENENGVSWTLNKEKGIWFGKRFVEDEQILLSGKVKKSDIVCYFNTRQEDEVIIDFDDVYEVYITHLNENSEVV